MSIPDDTRALKLVIEKADKLEGLSFTREILEARKIGLNASFHQEGFSFETNWPNDEAIDAFVLTLRFFVQDNEPSSLRNVGTLFARSELPEGLKDRVADMRAKLNEALDRPSMVVLAGTRLTRREIFDVFLWGGLAHANKAKKERYDQWARDPFLFAMLQLEFISVIVDILSGVFWLRGPAREALAVLGASDGS